MASGNFVVGQASKLVLMAGKSGEESVRGLNSLTLPLGWSATTLDIAEFGVPIDIKVTTGLAYDNVTCAGNFTIKDPTQALLRQYAMNSVKITDMRFYLDNCTFAALDLVSNDGGYYQVGTMTAPQGEKAGVYSFSLEISPSGQSTLFENQIGGITLDFTADSGSGATCTDSDSGFVIAGFKVDQVCYIDYLDGLDPLIAKIESVSAGQLTFHQGVGDEADITTAVGVATTRISSGEPMVFDSTSSNCF